MARARTSPLQAARVDAALASVDAWLEARRREIGREAEAGGDVGSMRSSARDRIANDAALARLIIVHRARTLEDINAALDWLGARPLPAKVVGAA